MSKEHFQREITALRECFSGLSFSTAMQQRIYSKICYLSPSDITHVFDWVIDNTKIKPIPADFDKAKQALNLRNFSRQQMSTTECDKCSGDGIIFMREKGLENAYKCSCSNANNLSNLFTSYSDFVI